MKFTKEVMLFIRVLYLKATILRGYSEEETMKYISKSLEKQIISHTTEDIHEVIFND